MTTSPVIETIGLTKHFGDTVALDDLTLAVPRGSIFGFLGPNGAGKSTMIRLLMGIIRPTAGSGSVLGFDVVTQREEVHRRVGYLPGDYAPYLTMTGVGYLDYLARLRGGVDPHVVEELATRFELDTSKKIGDLSHGNRQKVGLVQACMHEPELLILDEPTQGLDPLMQRVFLDLLRENRDAGRTVFLSSHILREVEDVADSVAIIRSGELATVSDVADFKARTRRRVQLTFNGTAPQLDELEKVGNVVSVTRNGPSIDVIVEGSMAEMLATASPFGIERVVSNEVDLEGVFLQYYEKG